MHLAFFNIKSPYTDTIINADTNSDMIFLVFKSGFAEVLA